MAKKQALDWTLAPAPESKDHGRGDRLLSWICGFLLALFFLLSILDLSDFLKDPSQHAIGQGSASAEDGWRERYLNRELTFLVGTAALFGLIVYAAWNPKQAWTKYALRITTIGVVGFVAMGYIAWICGGFDH